MYNGLNWKILCKPAEGEGVLTFALDWDIYMARTLKPVLSF